MGEVKQPIDYDGQIEKLRSRGCVISDPKCCKEALADIGYYRLSAYFLPFRKNDGTYAEGTTFDRVYSIYEFDKMLRNLIFSALEDIEISIRARLSYFHAHKYGTLGYLDASNFNNKHDAGKFERLINAEIENNRKVAFIRHHIENYDGQFPLWVITEVFTFGMLSHFYSDLTTADKKQLAGNDFRDMESWLRCCTDLRNICAHYGRLYFRIFSASPAGFDISEREKRGLWGALLAVRRLYPSAERWNHWFMPVIEALFEEYQDDIDLRHIAFPSDWAEKLRK